LASSVPDASVSPLLIAYIAISYTWGPPSLAIDIEVDGRYLSVRKNLYDFLITRRSEGSYSEHDLLWIDQICINQMDLTERSHRVAQMADIYQAAKEVHIWLGTGSDDLDPSMQQRPTQFASKWHKQVATSRDKSLLRKFFREDEKTAILVSTLDYAGGTSRSESLNPPIK